MVEKSHPEAPAHAEAEGFTQANTKPEKGNPVYEVGFHIVPTVGEEGVAGVVEKVRKALGDVELISEQFPAKMALAYVIERATAGKREKYAESYFGFIKFAGERQQQQTFQEALRAVREVLRFLVIETVREDTPKPARRSVFASTRLAGEVLQKPLAAPEKNIEVSEEELDKSIEALIS